MSDLSCPTCGSELDLAVLFAHEQDQRALARLASVSIPLGARVLQYLALFTPPKQRLTSAKKIKLILQLLPDLERQAITHKGRDWEAPLAAWAQAIDQMLAARDAQRLELPMKGHGYLFPRYRARMPLPVELVQGSSLPAAVAAIALKRLYGTSVPEELRRGAAWADQYLADLSKGVVSLGGADTEVAQPAGRMAARAPGSTFDWGRY